jgi:tripartite-type tricarboxylate transporter receptor subunit TctC
MNRLRQFLSSALMVGLVLLAGGPAQAQKIPEGTVTMIVPFPAGGGTDAFARALAEDLRVALKRTIVIQNIGGGGGSIGLSRLATSKPDGLTIGIGSTAGVVNVPILKPDTTPYDPLKDFIAIGQFTSVSHIFAVNMEKVPGVDSITKLVEYLKRNPGKVSYGTPGIGTGQHLAAELFQQMTGTKMLHVPYSGSSKVIPDLLGGQIDMAIDTGTVLLPQVKTGKLKLLAWTGRLRPEFDKHLPTVGESVPGYERTGWHGLLVPAKTPPEVVEVYAKALQAFATKPETISTFRDLGVQAVISTPNEYRDEIKRELDRVRQIIKNSSSKFE